MSFNEATNRPNFSPSIWGDYFISSSSFDDSLQVMKEGSIESEKYNELMKQVKNDITQLGPHENPFDKLEFIDAIQRLGLSYHFEKEIDEVLERLHHNSDHRHDRNNYNHEDNLYIDALRFRLFRQQGYNIACDVFNKFKNENDKFKESLSSDIRGMLSLYEAAQLRVHGEEILDEALIFTTTHLESIANKSSQLSSQSLLDQVNHALMHPIRKSLQRREARFFISIYNEQPSHNDDLLTLAKLDFNLLQKLHQKELSYITRWWKEFDYRSKQSFSRDRIVECYFWSYGVFFEAETSQIRLMMAKLIAILTIIDDIYDSSSGALKELELFAEAIDRWDICAMDNMPEYMKLCYKELLDFYNEIEEFTKERSYCLSYAKKGLQYQVRAYLKEAKWLHQKYIPTIDEYMPVGLYNAGSFVLITMAFIGMGDVVTKESMDWIYADDPQPKIVRTMSVVGRVMNDIAYHKSKQRRSGYVVASAVECYMKQHGVTDEEAIEKLSQQVSESWKNLNAEIMYPTTIPMPLLMRVLNFVRIIHEMYRYGDGFTHPTILKDLIDSLIINPLE